MPKNALQKAFGGTILKQIETPVTLSLREYRMLRVECKMLLSSRAESREDKAGFDPENDWLPVLEWLNDPGALRF
jgi:hypothetical protein